MQYYVQELQSFYQQHKSLVYSAGMALGVVFLLGGGIGFYYYRSLALSEEAQRVISDHLVKLNTARKEKDVNWDELDKMWDYDLKKYGSTSLAPYIVAYRAETKASAGDFDAARNYMKQAVSMMKPTSMGYGLFATTLALMNIDSTNTDEQKEGEQALAALASDMHNVDWERAAYYRGFYALKQNNVELAKTIFTTLAHNALPSSIWAERARTGLQHIDQLHSRQKEVKK